MGFHSKEAKRGTLRSLEPGLRRARLLAARRYPIRGIVRRAIIGGQWDGGEVVRQFLLPETPVKKGRGRG